MISRRHFLASAVALSSTFTATARAASAAPTAFLGGDIFERLMAKAKAEGWQRLPLGECMGRIALELMGTPYVAHTLEREDALEYCTVDLRGLDCVTFFECSLHMARILRAGTPTPEAMLASLRNTRYRDGVQTDYASRLHYTTDWIWDNARRGNVRDLVPELPGAAPFTQQVGFMSAHPESYQHLRAHPEWVPAIRRTEDQINARPKQFIPQDRIAAIEPLLQTGDIIGIATSTPGIDISHTGLCVKDEQGVARFANAASAKSKMKVVLDGPIHLAIANSPRSTGIVVARPL